MGKRTGIHIVKSEKPAAHVTDQIPTARIQKHGFIADVIVSKSESAHIYHYVIQPEGSNEIVHWGQELSFKRALDSIESFYEPYSLARRTA